MNTKFTTDTKIESEIAYFENVNLKLESGDIIDNFKLAFKTFGEAKDNEIYFDTWISKHPKSYQNQG